MNDNLTLAKHANSLAHIAKSRKEEEFCQRAEDIEHLLKILLKEDLVADPRISCDFIRQRRLWGIEDFTVQFVHVLLNEVFGRANEEHEALLLGQIASKRRWKPDPEIEQLREFDSQACRPEITTREYMKTFEEVLEEKITIFVSDDGSTLGHGNDSESETVEMTVKEVTSHLADDLGRTAIFAKWINDDDLLSTSASENKVPQRSDGFHDGVFFFNNKPIAEIRDNSAKLLEYLSSFSAHLDLNFSDFHSLETCLSSDKSSARRQCVSLWS